jgi:branched-chain amino acid aminotransferase
MDMVVFLNGQFIPEQAAVVPVSDRGFLYGDGLFETLRVFRGRPFRLAQHLERLARGSEFLGIPLPHPPKQLQRFVEELVEKNQMADSVLRITLTRGAGERGYTPPLNCTPTLLMALHPAPPLDLQQVARCSLITSSYRVPAADALSSFKTANKLPHVMARREAQAGSADEALMLNTNGEVAEAAGANLFWIYRDKVCTIPTGRGVLPGITRAVVLEICQGLNLPTNKRVIKPNALPECDALFLTQSVHGIVAVASLDGQPVPHSPVVDQLHQAYCEMLARE